MTTHLFWFYHQNTKQQSQCFLGPVLLLDFLLDDLLSGVWRPNEHLRSRVVFKSLFYWVLW